MQVVEAGQATGAAPSASPPTLPTGESTILCFPSVDWQEGQGGRTRGERATVQSVVHASSPPAACKPS